MARYRGSKPAPQAVRSEHSDSSSDNGAPILTPPETALPSSPPAERRLQSEIDRIVDEVVERCANLMIDAEAKPQIDRPQAAPRKKRKAKKNKRAADENVKATVKDSTIEIPKIAEKTEKNVAKRNRKPKEVIKAGNAKVENAKLEDSPKVKLSMTKKTTVVGAFDAYFGEASLLANWQRLCADVGVETTPRSITQAKKALKDTWVNIFDFLDAVTEGKKVKKFDSEIALAKYTIGSGRVYPKKHAKEEGPVRALLAKVSRAKVPKAKVANAKASQGPK